MKLISDIKTCNWMETIKKDANALSIQLQVKAMELNSFYICVIVCVCVCLLFKTNSAVELKLLHIICLRLSSFSVCQKKRDSPIIHPGSQIQTKKITRFTFRKKVVKNNSSTSKGTKYSLFAQCNHRTGKSPYNLYIWHGFF